MRNQGFSLIELLVTVAVVGLLSSIAVANYSEYKARAYEMEALALLHNGLTSIEAYRANDIQMDFFRKFVNHSPGGTISYLGVSDTESLLPGLGPISRDAYFFIQIYGRQAGGSAMLLQANSANCKGKTYGPVNGFPNKRWYRFGYNIESQIVDTTVLNVNCTY